MITIIIKPFGVGFSAKRNCGKQHRQTLSAPKKVVRKITTTPLPRVRRLSKKQRKREYANIKWGEVKPCCK